MNRLLLTAILIIASFSCANARKEGNVNNADTTYVRPPAVAGKFYPGAPNELAKMIAEFFHSAPKPQISGRPVAIISPHAGYIYSGQIAAKGYKILEGEEYGTVIVISPSHTLYFRGVSAFDGKAYATPFGEIPIDRDLTEKIVSSSDIISFSRDGHYKSNSGSEHALEVQLPFLQTTLGKFKLVALIMGDQDYSTCESLGRAISSSIIGRNDILIVASSDLSHFHDSKTAGHLDSVIAKDLGGFDYARLAEDLADGKAEACGGGPIIAAMIASKELGANSIKITDLKNSGDVTGDKSNVVGYLSAVIYDSNEAKTYEIEDTLGSKPAAAPAKDADLHNNMASGVEFGLSSNDKFTLLEIARKSIQTYFENKSPYYPDSISKALGLKLGAFVTLTEFEELRGCIGTFVASEPLYKTIANMAREAAFSDPRFSPVTPKEIINLNIEISVLSPMKRVYNPDSVVVGRDGLYMKQGYNSGVLLPQVPVEWGWERKQFLEQTCLKAGLSKDAWKDEKTEIYVFQAEIFGEGK